MDFARAGAVGLLLLLTGFGGLLVIPIESAAAQELTGQQSTYETLREMLEARAPDLADKIDRRLDEIDKGPGTPEQKQQRKEDYLKREIEQADQVLQAARRIGGNVTVADEVDNILRAMWVNQKAAVDILGDPFNPAMILSSGLREEFWDTEERLEEEREKAAEQQSGGVNQPLGLLPFRPLMEGEANQGHSTEHH